MSALGTSASTAAWRRIDVPGYDVVRLLRSDEGWRLAGIASWSEGGDACRLDYVVSVDPGWHTLACIVDGFIGPRSVTIAIARTDGGSWTINGVPAAAVERCDDVDLSFTPATNLLPIRRLALRVGERATVRAAWLRVPELDLQPLEQSYLRSADATYLYETAGGSFRRTLTVDAVGMVREYPGLWTAVSAADGSQRPAR